MGYGKRAQFTLRGNVAHIQYGNTSSYEKFDTPATAEMKAAFKAAEASGSTHDSLAKTSTQYAPLEVVETVKTVRSFITLPPPAPKGGVVVLTA